MNPVRPTWSVRLIATVLLATGACTEPAKPPSTSPQESKEVAARNAFDRKLTCAEYGEKRVREEHKSEGPSGRLLGPKYCYSVTLNTCIYSSGFFSKGATLFAVTDLLTNEELFSGGHLPNVPLPLTTAEFQAKEKELFATCIR